MGRKNNIALIFSFMLIFCSCEKQRFLNVPITSAQYVVNGLFTQNEPCHVEVSKSQNLSDTNNLVNISSATILLFEGNRFIEELKYAPPVPGQFMGSYTSDFKSFAKSKKYSIEVEVDGNSITASDVIPNQEIDISDFTVPLLADSNNEYLNFELVLKQTNATKKYFHILLQQRWVQFNISQGDSNLIFSDWFNEEIIPDKDPLGFIPSPSQPFSLKLDAKSQGVMLDNEEFSGMSKTVKFWGTRAYEPLTNTYLESRVIVRTLSENYFKYYYNSSQYYRTKNTPLTEPVIIHNNIVNGLGNFSAYSSDTGAIRRTLY